MCIAQYHFGDAQWTNKDRLSDALLCDLIEHFSQLPLGNKAARADVLGQSYEYLIKKFADAIPVLEKLILAAADEGLKQQVSFILAECCRETDDLEKAEKYYGAAIGLKGVEDEVLYRLGFVRFLQKDYAQAIAALEKSLTTNPNSSFADSARVYVARSLIAQKQYDKAIAILKIGGTAKPLDDSASLWLARAYMHQKDY